MAELVERDAEHLNLLAVLHYAAAGVTGLIACFPLIYVAMGAFFTFFPAAMRDERGGPPREVGLIFIGFGLTAVTIGWLFAGAHFVVARSLKQRRRYVFCVVVSAVTCFVCMMSSGIVSIATLVVLFRPGVRKIFEAPGAAATAGPTADRG